MGEYVGQDEPGYDLQLGHAGHAPLLHIGVLLQTEDQGPRDPAVFRPAHKGHGQDRVAQARSHNADERDDEHGLRHSDHNVRKTGDKGIRPPRHPASTPRKMPMQAEMAMTMNTISIDVRPP